MSAAQTGEAKPTQGQAQTQAQAQAGFVPAAAVVVEKRTVERGSFFTSFSNMLGIGNVTGRTLDAQKPQSPQTPAANAARRFGI